MGHQTAGRRMHQSIRTTMLTHSLRSQAKNCQCRLAIIVSGKIGVTSAISDFRLLYESVGILQEKLDSISLKLNNIQSKEKTQRELPWENPMLDLSH
mmetsp:Transcript_18059/g.23963  ORF Transcript_18059/g.23963 Transcript_18059/m.23963 type:complete len:97 (-) Transcript_18059:389-679(-)